MRRIIHCCVLTPQERLDIYARSLLEGFSRSMIDDLISRRELVFINGKLCTKSSTKLKKKDELLITFDDQEKNEMKPYQGIIPSLDILFENEHIIIINKPLGISVHPGDGLQREATIVDALLARKDVSFSIKGTRRPGIIHRLDKWTSGALILAKTDQAVDFYTRAFHDRLVHKEYVALLHGSFPHQYGHIEAPVGRSQQDRKKMAVTAVGRSALTEFSLLEKHDKYSLMNIILHTGRTHQIRVHFSSVGYPVVGDTEYSKKPNPFPEQLSGQFLHAHTLQVPDLNNVQNMITVQAPLPQNFVHILQTLGFHHFTS